MLQVVHPIKPLFGTNQEALVSESLQKQKSESPGPYNLEPEPEP